MLTAYFRWHLSVFYIVMFASAPTGLHSQPQSCADIQNIISQKQIQYDQTLAALRLARVERNCLRSVLSEFDRVESALASGIGSTTVSYQACASNYVGLDHLEIQSLHTLAAAKVRNERNTAGQLTLELQNVQARYDQGC